MKHDLTTTLENFTYHIQLLLTERPNDDAPHSKQVVFGLTLGGLDDCPLVSVEVCIKPSSGRDWGVWAQVYMRPMTKFRSEPQENPNVLDGSWKWCGNRCGGREEYAKLCAPVIAWVAAHSK